MEIDSSELTEYLQALTKSLRDGLKDTGFHVKAETTPITIELAVLNKKEAEHDAGEKEGEERGRRQVREGND